MFAPPVLYPPLSLQMPLLVWFSMPLFSFPPFAPLTTTSLRTTCSLVALEAMSATSSWSSLSLEAVTSLRYGYQQAFISMVCTRAADLRSFDSQTCAAPKSHQLANFFSFSPSRLATDLPASPLCPDVPQQP